MAARILTMKLNLLKDKKTIDTWLVFSPQLKNISQIGSFPQLLVETTT